MIVYGSFYIEGKFQKGFINLECEPLVHENNEYLRFTVKEEFQKGRPLSYDIKGIILPLLFNAHTHTGDAALKEDIKKGLKQNLSVKELVAPPSGLKHILLESTPESRIIDGICDYIRQMASNGTFGFMDFREGGIDGLNIFLDALLKAHSSERKTNTIPHGVVLGRPSWKIMAGSQNGGHNLPLTQGSQSSNVEQGVIGSYNTIEKTPSGNFEKLIIEIKEILKKACGINLSGISDMNYEIMKEIRKLTGQKIFAFHGSEDRREPVDKMIDLNPSFLVHMNFASNSDILALKDANIPIVTCPSSSMFFGFKPPLMDFYQNDIDIMIGTDNAMFREPDMLKEISLIRNNYPEIPVETILEWSTGKNFWDKYLNNYNYTPYYTKGGPGGFMAVRGDINEPEMAFDSISSHDITFLMHSGFITIDKIRQH